MKFWSSFVNWIKNNKEDILAVFVMSFVIIFILSSYTFNSLAPQEGWYSIYARNILQYGLVPYRDFPLVVPPFSLYIWTVWQAIFGDNFIVFHYLNFIFQISCAISLYFLFKQIFNIKIAIIMSSLLTVMKIFSEWDNGVASYNTLALAFIALTALFTIKQVDFINTYKKISTKWLWRTGFIFAVSFLNKQTSGALTIMASCLILMAITYRVLGIKNAVKYFMYLFFVSILFIAVFLIPLLIAGALPSMIVNIFNATSKGSLLILFINLLVLPFPLDLWFYYVLLIIASIIFLPKVKYSSFEESNDKGCIKKFLLIFVLIFMVIFLIANGVFVAYYPLLGKLHYVNASCLYVLYHTSYLFAVILLFYLMIIWVKGHISDNKLNLLIIILFLIFENIANLLSSGFHYQVSVVLCLGLLLAWRWTKFNKIKNIILFLTIIIFFTVGFAYKLYSPMTFWGWQSGSVLETLDTSYVPRMKGMKIPTDEKQMYEEIYEVVHKYTDENDTILAFNNNQIFYDLTERKPYTQYISLYHDVSPDNQPLEVLEKIRKNPPKIIIFLRFSDDIEKFHENLYRGHISGQRKLRDYIDSLVNDGKYIPVKSYTQSKFLDIDNLPAELIAEYKKIDQNSPGILKQEFLRKIEPFIKIKNGFMQPDCVLAVLVKSDLIKN